MNMNCKITGKLKRKPNPDGSCPECRAPKVKLTGKGFVAAHKVPIDLGEGPQVPLTDEGARVGDPRDAMLRREIMGAKIRAGQEPLPMGGVADPVVTTGHGRGPVLVRGRAMDATKITGPRERKGDKPVSNTMSGNLGRERFDHEAVQREPAKRTKAAQRRYRACATAQRRMAARLARQGNGKASK